MAPTAGADEQAVASCSAIDSIDRIHGIEYNERYSDEPVFAMASLTIRNLDDRTKNLLRLRAALHNRSMEEEARQILREAVETTGMDETNLVDSIRRRFAALGGFDLGAPERESIRTPPELGH